MGEEFFIDQGPEGGAPELDILDEHLTLY